MASKCYSKDHTIKYDRYYKNNIKSLKILFNSFVD